MDLSDKIKNAKRGTSLFDELSPEEIRSSKMRASISVAILNERRQRGLSQSEFAEICGVTKDTISKWESGEHGFSIADKKRLAALSILQLGIHENMQ